MAKKLIQPPLQNRNWQYRNKTRDGEWQDCTEEEANSTQKPLFKKHYEVREKPLPTPPDPSSEIVQDNPQP